MKTNNEKFDASLKVYDSFMRSGFNTEETVEVLMNLALSLIMEMRRDNQDKDYVMKAISHAYDVLINIKVNDENK